MEAPRLLSLPDGRTLAFDEVGDRHGVPVVYLHGTPDSRLARHPDDGVAAAAGLRLIAVDRPGSGDSDLHAAGTLASLGRDLGHLLDSLEIEEVALLGWSAGGLFALAAATVLRDRALAVGLVGTLPPAEAYADRVVLDALGPTRGPFIEMAAELSPEELAGELAPYLVPQPLSPDLALEHVLESAGPRGRAELELVEGAAEQLAMALMASVKQGLDGLRHDIALQLELGLDLAAVNAPVRSFHGAEDTSSPPEVGAWLASHLPNAVLDLVPAAGHHMLFPRWRGILRALVRDASTR